MKFLIYGLLFCTSIYLSESTSDQFYGDDALKAALKLDVSNLYDAVAKEFKNVSGHIERVNTLEKLVKFVSDINAKVDTPSLIKTYNTSSLGQEIVKLVQKLIDEGTLVFTTLLKSEQAGSDTKTDKNAIIETVGNLYDGARTEYEKLVEKNTKESKDNNTVLIGGLKTCIQIVKDIDKGFMTTPPTTYVGKTLQTGVEKIIRQIETVLEMDLKAVMAKPLTTPKPLPTPNPDSDIRDSLLKEASDFYVKFAAGEIELGKGNKTALVAGLQKEINFIKELTDKVKALKPTTDLETTFVQLIEKFAKAVQDLLKKDLDKANSVSFYDAVKDDFLNIAGDLINKFKAAYEKLAKEDKPKLVDDLEKTITLVKDTETELKKMMPTTTIGKAILDSVEKMVKQIESVLEMELKAVKGF